MAEFKIGDLVTGSDGYNQYTGKVTYIGQSTSDVRDSAGMLWAVHNSTMTAAPKGSKTGWLLAPEAPFPEDAPATKPSVMAQSLRCHYCDTPGPHAEPNRANGGFACWSCRSVGRK